MTIIQREKNAIANAFELTYLPTFRTAKDGSKYYGLGIIIHDGILERIQERIPTLRLTHPLRITISERNSNGKYTKRGEIVVPVV